MHFWREGALLQGTSTIWSSEEEGEQPQPSRLTWINFWGIPCLVGIIKFKLLISWPEMAELFWNFVLAILKSYIQMPLATHWLDLLLFTRTFVTHRNEMITRWMSLNDCCDFLSHIWANYTTLQGTSPYPTERKKENHRLKSALGWDMLQGGPLPFINGVITPIKWPCKWLTVFITLLIGVITTVIAGRGPTL